MNPLNQTLRAQAIQNGLCDAWQSDWSTNREIPDLIDMFKRGQDFCIQHDWPTLDTIRQNFPDADLRAGGIYLDAPNLDLTLHSGTYIFLGHCSGIVRFPRWAAAIIYLRHDTDLQIEASDNARIRIFHTARSRATILPSTSPTAHIRLHPAP